MNSYLRIAREGRLLRLTLNRPEKRNALNEALCRELAAALQSAEDDAASGAILLDAAGPVFCAGMDLDEALAPDAAQKTALHEELFTFGLRLRKPLVAAVQGPALAGGLGLVANAHVAIAAHGCTFGLTEIRIGMWPFVVQRAISAAVGHRRALELALTGRIFGTAEALQWGLLHQVVPAIELDDRATAVAAALADSSADALRLGLDYAQRCRTMPFEEAGRLAASLRARLFESPDFAEGVRALREKRKPEWPSLRAT